MIRFEGKTTDIEKALATQAGTESFLYQKGDRLLFDIISDSFTKQEV